MNAPHIPSQVNDPSKEVNLPRLLDALAERFRNEGHDQHKLMNWICKSQPYSLGNETTNADADKSSKFFAHYTARPLSGAQFRRTLQGLSIMSRQKTGFLNSTDLQISGFPEDVIQSSNAAISMQSILYLWNNPGFDAYLKGYWTETLRRNPKMTKSEAIQSASTYFLGKPMAEELLKSVMASDELPLSPEYMSRFTETIMSSSIFLQNR